MGCQWLEFKSDAEFSTRQFGSIAGGSALKFGLYRSKDSGEWMAGHPTNQVTLSLADAIAIARKHREQLIAAVAVIQDLPSGADDQAYLARLPFHSPGNLVQFRIAMPVPGYGSMTRIQMREINAGAKWRDMTANASGGQGSMGNGSAMRVAPLGAYFADNLEQSAEEARASSLVTHIHQRLDFRVVATADKGVRDFVGDQSDQGLWREVQANTKEDNGVNSSLALFRQRARAH